jgi:hypothetical protein
MNALPYTLLTICLALSQIIYAQDSLSYEKSTTLLIDGGIQSIESSGIDQSATGQLGFRNENLKGIFELKFTVASNTPTNINSNQIKDYSQFILNPFNTKQGLDALHVRFFRRSFTREGTAVNYARYMYGSGHKDMDALKYQEMIDEYGLKKYEKFIHKFGYLIDFNISNFSWTNIKDSLIQDGNLISFNPYITLNYRKTFLGTKIETVFGVGPSLRAITGDIEKDFINDILGSNKTTYIGAQGILQLFINNFYGKAHYGFYKSDPNIQGLTGGQFYISIGLQAKIGQIENVKISVPEFIKYGQSQRAQPIRN